MRLPFSSATPVATHTVEYHRYIDQDIPGIGENIARDDFARRAAVLILPGVHDGKARLSEQATRLSRGEAQAMSGIEEIELLCQSLYLGEVGVVCGAGIRVIGKL